MLSMKSGTGCGDLRRSTAEGAGTSDSILVSFVPVAEVVKPEDDGTVSTGYVEALALVFRFFGAVVRFVGGESDSR